MSSDKVFLQRAIELAKLGGELVEPNPQVGAVVVKDGEIVGEGWHEECGGPHAEVNALNAAGEKASGATLYVSLEPCNHHGRTPPCTELIVERKVKRVVFAKKDLNSEVKGSGEEYLREKGILVECFQG